MLLDKLMMNYDKHDYPKPVEKAEAVDVYMRMDFRAIVDVVILIHHLRCRYFRDRPT